MILCHHTTKTHQTFTIPQSITLVVRASFALLLRAPMSRVFLMLVLIVGNNHRGLAQVEHVPVIHPVYEVLQRWEAQKLVHPDFSSSALPLQRMEVVRALRSARQNESLLSESDRTILLRFEREFRIIEAERAIMFSSPEDSTQLVFDRLFTNDEKFVYTTHKPDLYVNVVPLVALSYRFGTYPDASSDWALLGDIGGRIFGTIDSAVGFYLQATNGKTLRGSREFLLNDPQLYQNLTLRLYDGRFFDFSESHLRYDYRWFYAGIGRETRLIGSGYHTRMVMSSNAPPADAVFLGAKFIGFEYRFTHFSLLGQPEPNAGSFGPGTEIPSKFMSYHRAAFRWAWGELAASESLIYTRRGIDLAYIVPVSLLRAVSNALLDRDNYQLMFDFTLRPLPGIQLKGNYILDDLRMPEVGKGWWANKSGWNIGVMLTPRYQPFDVSLEYARVEPYTFTHSEPQNTATNDGQLFAGSLPPNADELTAGLRFWWGNRYPLRITAAYRRHGQNIVDSQGKLQRNVGGNVLQNIRSHYDPQTGERVYDDSPYVTFLDGARENRFLLNITSGWEFNRQWNLQARYALSATNAITTHFFTLTLRFEDF